jgi:hypothetical protein
MNTRKDNNGKSLKAWRAMGPGLIEKPLQHIGNRTNSRDTKGNLILSPEFRHASQAAQRGRGNIVSKIARQIG